MAGADHLWQHVVVNRDVARVVSWRVGVDQHERQLVHLVGVHHLEHTADSLLDGAAQRTGEDLAVGGCVHRRLQGMVGVHPVGHLLAVGHALPETPGRVLTVPGGTKFKLPPSALPSSVSEHEVAGCDLARPQNIHAVPWQLVERRVLEVAGEVVSDTSSMIGGAEVESVEATMEVLSYTAHYYSGAYGGGYQGKGKGFTGGKFGGRGRGGGGRGFWAYTVGKTVSYRWPSSRQSFTDIVL